MAQRVKAKRLWAASRKGDARAVAAMLGDERLSVDVNTAMDDGRTPLYAASQQGHSEVVSMLLAKPGVDVNKAWDGNGQGQVTPLRTAINRSHAEVAKLLVLHGSILVDAPMGAHGVQLNLVLGAFAQAIKADYDALCMFRLCLFRAYHDKPPTIEGASPSAQRLRTAAHLMIRRGSFAMPRIESFLLPCHSDPFRPDLTVRRTLNIILNLSADT